jgi:hypothetical protein
MGGRVAETGKRGAKHMSILPPALARQCRLVSWDDNRLVFHAASPVWKNKLRLHSQEVLAAAQLLGLHAREIRIKVDVGFTPNANQMA